MKKTTNTDAKKWFTENLRVTRFPTPEEITKSDFDYIINVSDEFKPDCHLAATKCGKKYFWFPMNECTDNIGVNSIYGALQILWIAEKENAKVNLHCHAGVNRSVTVSEAYYFMRTGEHKLATSKFPHFQCEDFYRQNRLQGNCGRGLPSIIKMETILKKCAIALTGGDGKRGFLLDDILTHEPVKIFKERFEIRHKPISWLRGNQIIM